MKLITYFILVILFFFSPLFPEPQRYKYKIDGFKKETLTIDDSFQSVTMDDYLYFMESEKKYDSFDELLCNNEYKRNNLPKGKSPNFGYSKNT